VTPTLNTADQEIAFIDAFVLKDRRERLRCLVVNPRRRKQFVQELAHFKWLDRRHVKNLAPSAQNPEDIANLLRQKGAPDVCFLVSEDSVLDRKQLPLLAALEQVVGRGMGTFISCIPGRLAYFEDEDQRCVLEK
jgi:hypothetical protein